MIFWEEKNLLSISKKGRVKNCPLIYWKRCFMKKVFTVGVFDLLHIGHVNLFKRAKSLGDYLTVAVQDSNSVYKFKPKANLIGSTEYRMAMVAAIRYVDNVVAYNNVDDIIKEVDFDVFVTGTDQNHSGFQKAIQWCEEHGKEHIVLKRTEGVSSSEIKSQIEEQTK